jgi:Zn-dependent oligopeptidase
MNPLLDFSGLPRFDAVTPEHVAPAIRELIDENRRPDRESGRSANAGDLG